MIDKAGEKNYSYQPAAGKILEKYFQRWTTTKLQVKGKHQVALESNLYLVSKLFCDPLLKLRLISLFYCLALVKVTSVVKYENGGQVSDLSKLSNEWDAGMKRT